jgi:hypothetical protein
MLFPSCKFVDPPTIFVKPYFTIILFIGLSGDVVFGVFSSLRPLIDVSFSLASGLPFACLGEPHSPGQAVCSVTSNGA